MVDLQEERDHFDPDDLPWDVFIFRRILIYLLVLYNYDVFAIYKGKYAGSSRAKYRHFMVAELRMKPDYWDGWRIRWKFVHTIVYVIFSIRYTAICIVQLILYQAKLSADNSNKSSERNMEDYSTGPMSTEYGDRHPNTPAIKLLSDYHILDIFSSALADHPGVSLMIHIALLASVTYSFLLVPQKYAKKPLNSPLMRFRIDPLREIRRMELFVGEKIEDVIWNLNCHSTVGWSRSDWSAKQFKSTTVECVSRHSTERSPDNHGFERATSTIVRANTRLATLKPDPILTPARYNLNYYRKICSRARDLSYVVIVLAVSFLVLLQRNIIKSITDIQCNSRQMCTLREAFTWRDIESLGHMTMVMLWTGSFISVQIIELLLYVISQLHSINEVKYYLTDLLNAIRLLNDSSVELRVFLRNNRKLMFMTNNRCNDRTDGIFEDLNGALLKTLIKTRVSKDDLNVFTGQMSELVSSILVLFGSILILALSAGKIGGNDIATMRTNVFISIWIGSNILLIECAYVFTKMTRIEQLIWSIVALLRTLQARHCDIVGGELECLIKSWNDFALKQNTPDARNAVRPFGFSLTYRMVLKMNFSVITIAALLKQ